MCLEQLAYCVENGILQSNYDAAWSVARKRNPTLPLYLSHCAEGGFAVARTSALGHKQTAVTGCLTVARLTVLVDG